MAERILIMGDLHFPYHDPRAVEAVLGYARRFRPRTVVVGGDLLDAEDLSRFPKDPRMTARFEAEVELACSFLSRLPGKVRLLEGNHEARLRKYLWKNAPALSGLRSVSIPALLGVPPASYLTKPLKIGKLLVQHGTSYGPTVGRNNLACWPGLHVAQGHSHRLSQVWRRTHLGTVSSVEWGCLCDLEPRYCHQPDWQLGFASWDGEELRLHRIEKGRVL